MERGGRGTRRVHPNLCVAPQPLWHRFLTGGSSICVAQVCNLCLSPVTNRCHTFWDAPALVRQQASCYSTLSMTTLVEQPVVLAIGVQPDDAGYLCTGTLALLKRKGWRVVLASMSSGNATSTNHTSSSLEDVRRLEAQRAAALLEAECCGLALPALGIVYNDDMCRRVTVLIRTVRPAMVLTHGPQDATPDAEQTSRLVRQACLAAPTEGYHTRAASDGAQPTGRIPHLYYFDPLELIDYLGCPVEAALVVDISAAIDTKDKVVAQFTTCPTNHRESNSGQQHTEQVRAWARQRGGLVGCRFGEGFRQHLGPPYPRDNLLKEVLGEHVHAVR